MPRKLKIRLMLFSQVGGRVQVNCLPLKQKKKFKTHINFDSQQIQIVFGFDAPNMTAADYYTGKVLNSVLSGGMFGRMFSEVREKEGFVILFSQHIEQTDFMVLPAMPAQLRKERAS